MTSISCWAQETTNATIKGRFTLRGYKAFYEVEYGFDIDNEELDHDGNRIPAYPHCNNLIISTTQGYQVNNYFFAGGGVGVLHYLDGKHTVMPIFADLRLNFLNNKIVEPTMGARVGCVVGCWGGLYASAWLGARFRISNNHALSIAVGIMNQNDFTAAINDEETAWYATSLGVKLGYEF